MKTKFQKALDYQQKMNEAVSVRSLDRILPNYTSKGISGTKIIKGRVLKSHKSTTSKYYYVHLRGNGISKEASLHRLVAKAFVPNPNNLPQVNHIDETQRTTALTILNGVLRSIILIMEHGQSE